MRVYGECDGDGDGYYGDVECLMSYRINWYNGEFDKIEKVSRTLI